MPDQSRPEAEGLSTGLVGRLDAAVARGDLRADAGQAAAAIALHALAERLNARRWFGRRKIRGLYLWGEVGRGKSMLMDMFFAETARPAKRRVHFNAFMGEIHRRLEDARRQRRRDPMSFVADAIAADTRLLCFDEFQVNDVADAMILGRLFQRLFARRVTVVATSNVAPSDLYLNGLNRPLFLPFIALMVREMMVLEMPGTVDHRACAASGAAWFSPLGPEADAGMDAVWARLGGGGRSETLDVSGRKLTVTCATKDAARLSFLALCETHLGAADYLALAERFPILLIDRIPFLTENNRDAAKRFQILIDTLYDRGTVLYASAAGEPADIAPGEELKRTVSRLLEMRSGTYIKARSRKVDSGFRQAAR